MTLFTLNGLDLPLPYGFCNHLQPEDEFEEISNPIQAVKDIWRGFNVMLQCHAEIRANGTYAEDFNTIRKCRDDLAFFNNGEPFDIVILIGLALLWTIARQFLVKCVFMPLTDKLGVMPRNVKKFAESCWKLVAYSAMWFVIVYVSFFRGHHIFDKSMELFRDWKYHYYPQDLKYAYFLEAGFYMHALYATTCLDVQRHDLPVMLSHHFVTLTLIFCSYVLGVLKIGVLIFLLNDVSDILLEAGKVCNYLKTTRFGYSRVANAGSVVFGLLFWASFLVLRMIFHLTKVWRAASLGSVSSIPFLPAPFHIYFNILLGFLYAFYGYWFFFISILAYILLTCTTGLNPDKDMKDD